ncbi:hypothetical protein HKX29_17605 [Sulfitobacter sp. S46]|uniref:hypothetical protein n=1 Tax=unclassified Sulfitobacter TaxID=196795 RepID=UPI0023E225BE|nr:MULTISPECIES: hypothetical protein [unclassified Sulfitobacter]MDF3420168.1 hypothetical protein [Sulfitobacter sp. Ks38]MDF3431232.1 hypothetical protein [Sulfitobacter sp. S46]MDF3446005.1 hypothetical protein [Sulfitobacter sp. KE31]MDF3550014.1 hypothetical protein [Sulfitobacter sp. KE28]
MGLDWSAVTMASHLCLVFAIACAFVNAVAARRNWIAQAPVEVFARLEGPIFALAATLMVERLYYVTARLMINSELDLWSAHPAPEMLSFSIAVSMFWLASAIRCLDGTIDPRARRAIIGQSCAFAFMFASVAWGFW